VRAPRRPGSRRLPPDERSAFDRFAERLARFVAHPLFFVGCVLSIVVWAASGPLAGYSSRWQLVINTGTTIITFLMVALLQNAQRRDEMAVHRKLDAIADALADFMDKSELELDEDVKELEEAVWLEKVQGSKEGREAKAQQATAIDDKKEGKPRPKRPSRAAARERKVARSR
jgi:low affinity Fe/Cu permease